MPTSPAPGEVPFDETVEVGCDLGSAVSSDYCAKAEGEGLVVPTVDDAITQVRAR